MSLMSVADSSSQERERLIPCALQAGVRRQSATKRRRKHQSMLLPQLYPIYEKAELFTISSESEAKIHAGPAGCSPLELPATNPDGARAPFFSNEPWLINDQEFAYNLRTAPEFEASAETNAHSRFLNRVKPLVTKADWPTRPSVADVVTLRVSTDDPRNGRNPPRPTRDVKAKRPTSMIDRPRWTHLRGEDDHWLNTESIRSTESPKASLVKRMASLSIASSFSSETTSLLREMLFDEQGNIEDEISSPPVPDMEYTFTDPVLFAQDSRHGVFRKPRESSEQGRAASAEVIGLAAKGGASQTMRQARIPRYYATFEPNSEIERVSTSEIKFPLRGLTSSVEGVNSPVCTQARKIFGFLRQ